MRKLNLRVKSGFKIKEPYKPVVIRDFRGILFYTTEPMLPRVRAFNLPAGEYVVECGNFNPLKSPIKCKLAKLPPHERNYPDPSEFPIIWGNNPNKCSIFWDKKFILFDRSFQDKPLWVFDFIKSHEFGHRYYRTEKFCDLYAVNRMKMLGYNSSQIGSAPILSLSSGQHLRKDFMINNITKTA